MSLFIDIALLKCLFPNAFKQKPLKNTKKPVKRTSFEEYICHRQTGIFVEQGL